MIEITDEMADAFDQAWRAYWVALGHETPEGGPTVAEHGREANRAGLAAALAIAERDYERPLREAVIELHGVLVDMVDPDPCHFDHHGYCQAHGWLQDAPRCPHARAKEVLS